MEDLVRAIALPALLLACACQEEKSPIQPGTYFPVAIALGPTLGGTYDHPSPCAACLQGPCAFVFRFGAREGIEAMEGFRTCAAQGPPFASCWTALAGEPNDPVSPDDPIFEPSEWFDPKAASCCAATKCAQACDVPDLGCPECFLTSYYNCQTTTGCKEMWGESWVVDAKAGCRWSTNADSQVGACSATDGVPAKGACYSRPLGPFQKILTPADGHPLYLPTSDGWVECDPQVAKKAQAMPRCPGVPPVSF